MPNEASRAELIELIDAEASAQRELALSDELRTRFGTQVIRDGSAVTLIAPGADIASLNRAVGFGFDRSLTVERLATINAAYVRAGVPRWIVDWGPERSPSEGAAIIEEHGGVAKTPTVKLWRTVERDLPPVKRNGLEVVEIGTDGEAVFRETVGRAVRLPDYASGSVTSTLGWENWRFYVVYDRETPIAGATMFVRGDGAWFGIAGTLPEARGRGAQSALLAHRLNEAARLGCKWVTADTSPDTPAQSNPSYRNMIRVGLQPVYNRAKYLFDVNTVRIPEIGPPHP